METHTRQKKPVPAQTGFVRFLAPCVFIIIIIITPIDAQPHAAHLFIVPHANSRSLTDHTARQCAFPLGCQQHFRAYDADGNGSIDANELRTVVNNLGENITRVKLMALINEVDLDGNHTIEFAEFLTLMLRIRSGTAKKSGLAKIVKKTASTYHVKGSGSNHHAQHAFSETEKRAFSEHINFCLGKDSQLQQLGHVPINIDSMDLFTAVRDGTGELPARSMLAPRCAPVVSDFFF